MKTTLSVLVLLFAYGKAFACDKRVDPSKVILFVDTNTSEPEIDRAEKAACARGEKLVIVPGNLKDYKKLVEDQTRTEKELIKCTKTKGEDNCDVYKNRASASYNALDEFVQKQGTLTDQTQKALEEVRKNGGKIDTLIVSGHDGGGKFSGLKGTIDKNDLKKLMDEFSDTNQIKSLLLLGCYTGVQKEILDWKSIFPEIALIGGYDGSAPLAQVPAGHQYLTDLLMKGPVMIEEARKKTINNYAKNNLSTLLNLNSAVYLQCGDDQNFYYSSKNKDLGFNQFNMKACENIAKLKEIETLVAKYNYGEIEPPKDTAHGDLRKLYNEARALEHCFVQKKINVDVKRVFNLLFYNGIKQSFAHFYKDDLKKAEEALKSLDYQALKEKILETVTQDESKLEILKNEQKLMEKDLPAYIAAKKKDYEEAQSKKQAAFMFLSKEAKSVIGMDDQVDFLKSQNLNPKDAAAVGEYQKLIYATFGAKSNYEGLLKDPELNKAFQRNQIISQEKRLESLKGYLANYNSRQDDLKKIWIPTQENLAKKSRKETLQNQHVLSFALTLQGLSQDQRDSLDKVHKITENHLVYFENPFSWHDYNGRKVDDPYENP